MQITYQKLMKTQLTQHLNLEELVEMHVMGYADPAPIREAIKQSLTLLCRVTNNTREVYVVERNNDFTEGRGPMVFESVCATWDDANDYVMGKGHPYGLDFGPTPSKVDDNTTEYGGWYRVRKVPVMTAETIQDQAEIKKQIKETEKRLAELMAKVA